ncbi:unnamed protein product [Gongylonema pulchrum]|uniref:TRAM domain-containing protein n=1 Tax=Gongylonema pulchrum TaxID=637853 RepID=A0A183ECS8_9BILA|nr:unnamed protein product [Gongylonema pulchrum]
MSALFRSYSRYNKNRIGEKHRVLVCELATDRQHYVGHNKCYEHFLIPSQKCLLGSWVHVRIVDVSKFYMKATLLNYDSCVFLDSALSRIQDFTSNFWLTALSTLVSLFVFWFFML